MEAVTPVLVPGGMLTLRLFEPLNKVGATWDLEIRRLFLRVPEFNRRSVDNLDAWEGKTRRCSPNMPRAKVSRDHGQMDNAKRFRTSHVAAMTMAYANMAVWRRSKATIPGAARVVCRHLVIPCARVG